MDGCLFKPTGLDDLRMALAALTFGAVTDHAAAVFDLSALITLTDGDKCALNELLEPLLGSLLEDRAVLARLPASVDFAKLYDLAHRVKGGARMVKAQALISCCETLEGVCERRDSDALGAALAAIGVAIERLHDALVRYCRQA